MHKPQLNQALRASRQAAEFASSRLRRARGAAATAASQPDTIAIDAIRTIHCGKDAIVGPPRHA